MPTTTALPLSAATDEIREAAVKLVYRYISKRRVLPGRRRGYTQKARVGGHKVYLRTGEFEDGSLGERNDVRVAGINHKMGYRGIVNTLLNFGEGTAYQPAGKAGAEALLATAHSHARDVELDKADLAAANWAWANDRTAGRGSDTLPGAKRLFLPMRTGRGLIGVIGIDDDRAVGRLCVNRRQRRHAKQPRGQQAADHRSAHRPGELHRKLGRRQTGDGRR